MSTSASILVISITLVLVAPLGEQPVHTQLQSTSNSLLFKSTLAVEETVSFRLILFMP
jgi:hypothetical protein